MSDALTADERAQVAAIAARVARYDENIGLFSDKAIREKRYIRSCWEEDIRMLLALVERLATHAGQPY